MFLSHHRRGLFCIEQTILKENQISLFVQHFTINAIKSLYTAIEPPLKYIFFSLISLSYISLPSSQMIICFNVFCKCLNNNNFLFSPFLVASYSVQWDRCDQKAGSCHNQQDWQMSGGAYPASSDLSLKISKDWIDLNKVQKRL